MNLLFYLLALVVVISGKPTKCPENCICDFYENMRRIRCANQRLLNIGHMPSRTQVLDISNNQIRQLGNYELMELGLTSLKLLNVSHNKIGHIELYAFVQLNNLRTIDLSYNALAYLLDWFYDLKKLKELYLNNNNFANLPDGPIIESKSLKILDISNSRISHIKNDAFSKLPNLEKLYLDGNSLIQLNVLTISILNNLHTLSVKDNSFTCDDDAMIDVKMFMTSANMYYEDSCNNQKTFEGDKFQRMVALEPSQPEDDKNSWILEETDEENSSNVSNCTRIDEQKGLLIEIIEISPIFAIVIPFVIGCLFGMILACSIQIKPLKKKPPTRRRRYSIIRRTIGDFADPLVLHSENIYESTPVPQRKMDMYALSEMDRGIPGHRNEF